MEVKAERERQQVFRISAAVKKNTDDGILLEIPPASDSNKVDVYISMSEINAKKIVDKMTMMKNDMSKISEEIKALYETMKIKPVDVSLANNYEKRRVTNNLDFIMGFKSACEFWVGYQMQHTFGFVEEQGKITEDNKTRFALYLYWIEYMLLLFLISFYAALGGKDVDKVVDNVFAGLVFEEALSMHLPEESLYSGAFRTRMGDTLNPFMDFEKVSILSRKIVKHSFYGTNDMVSIFYNMIRQNQKVFDVLLGKVTIPEDERSIYAPLKILMTELSRVVYNYVSSVQGVGGVGISDQMKMIEAEFSAEHFLNVLNALFYFTSLEQFKHRFPLDTERLYDSPYNVFMDLMLAKSETLADFSIRIPIGVYGDLTSIYEYMNDSFYSRILRWVIDFWRDGFDMTSLPLPKKSVKADPPFDRALALSLSFATIQKCLMTYEHFHNCICSLTEYEANACMKEVHRISNISFQERHTPGFLRYVDRVLTMIMYRHYSIRKVWKNYTDLYISFQADINEWARMLVAMPEINNIVDLADYVNKHIVKRWCTVTFENLWPSLYAYYFPEQFYNNPVDCILFAHRADHKQLPVFIRHGLVHYTILNGGFIDFSWSLSRSDLYKGEEFALYLKPFTSRTQMDVITLSRYKTIVTVENGFDRLYTNLYSVATRCFRLMDIHIADEMIHGDNKFYSLYSRTSGYKFASYMQEYGMDVSNYSVDTLMRACNSHYMFMGFLIGLCIRTVYRLHIPFEHHGILKGKNVSDMLKELNQFHIVNDQLRQCVLFVLKMLRSDNKKAKGLHPISMLCSWVYVLHEKESHKTWVVDESEKAIRDIATEYNNYCELGAEFTKQLEKNLLSLTSPVVYKTPDSVLPVCKYVRSTKAQMLIKARGREAIMGRWSNVVENNPDAIYVILKHFSNSLEKEIYVSLFLFQVYDLLWDELIAECPKLKIIDDMHIEEYIYALNVKFRYEGVSSVMGRTKATDIHNLLRYLTQRNQLTLLMIVAYGVHSLIDQLELVIRFAQGHRRATPADREIYMSEEELKEIIDFHGRLLQFSDALDGGIALFDFHVSENLLEIKQRPDLLEKYLLSVTHMNKSIPDGYYEDNQNFETKAAEIDKWIDSIKPYVSENMSAVHFNLPRFLSIMTKHDNMTIQNRAAQHVFVVRSEPTSNSRYERLALLFSLVSFVPFLGFVSSEEILAGQKLGISDVCLIISNNPSLLEEKLVSAANKKMKATLKDKSMVTVEDIKYDGIRETIYKYRIENGMEVGPKAMLTSRVEYNKKVDAFYSSLNCQTSVKDIENGSIFSKMLQLSSILSCQEDFVHLFELDVLDPLTHTFNRHLNFYHNMRANNMVHMAGEFSNRKKLEEWRLFEIVFSRDNTGSFDSMLETFFSEYKDMKSVFEEIKNEFVLGIHESLKLKEYRKHFRNVFIFAQGLVRDVMKDVTNDKQMQLLATVFNVYVPDSFIVADYILIESHAEFSLIFMMFYMAYTISKAGAGGTRMENDGIFMDDDYIVSLIQNVYEREMIAEEEGENVRTIFRSQ